MTCIYDAWSEALRIGHDQIQLKKEPILQQTMFDEYVHVDGDNVKAEKVIRSVRRDISDEAYLDVYYATLSAEEDALQAIYNFLRVGFAVGSKVLEQYSNPHVMRMLELRRMIHLSLHGEILLYSCYWPMAKIPSRTVQNEELIEDEKFVLI